MRLLADLSFTAQSFQPDFDFEGLDMEEFEQMDEDDDDEGEEEPPAKKARN